MNNPNEDPHESPLPAGERVRVRGTNAYSFYPSPLRQAQARQFRVRVRVRVRRATRGMIKELEDRKIDRPLVFQRELLGRWQYLQDESCRVLQVISVFARVPTHIDESSRRVMGNMKTEGSGDGLVGFQRDALFHDQHRLVLPDDSVDPHIGGDRLVGQIGEGDGPLDGLTGLCLRGVIGEIDRVLGFQRVGILPGPDVDAIASRGWNLTRRVSRVDARREGGELPFAFDDLRPY